VLAQLLFIFIFSFYYCYLVNLLKSVIKNNSLGSDDPNLNKNVTMKRNCLKMLFKMLLKMYLNVLYYAHFPCHAVHVKNKLFFYLKYVLNIFYVYLKVI
jgi:hypothetical protein